MSAISVPKATARKFNGLQNVTTRLGCSRAQAGVQKRTKGTGEHGAFEFISRPLWDPFRVRRFGLTSPC
jgi:hypothetical protein